MAINWERTQTNTSTRWQAEAEGRTLVVEKTPGYDPAYAVYEGETAIHQAWIWGGTVKDAKDAAVKRAKQKEPSLT